MAGRFSRIATSIGIALLVSPGFTPSSAATRVGGSIDEDTTWTAAGSPYVVFKTVTVSGGVTLTLEPGVVVKARTKRVGLRVRGNLLARGAPNDPVVFTSFRDDSAAGDTNGDGSRSHPAPGDWQGLWFDVTGIPASSIVEHAEIRYAGGRAWRPLGRSASLGSEISDLVVENCVITRGAGDGVLLARGSYPAIESNDISSNAGYAVYMENADSARAVIERNAVRDNGTDAVRLGPGIEESAAWHAGMPYVMDEDIVVAEGKKLTLLPGTVVKAAAPARELRVYGRLVANGTSGARVILTSLADDDAGGDTDRDGGATPPRPGNWAGVSFIATYGGDGDVLDHADVRYAGGRSWGRFGRSASVLTEISDLVIRDSTIADGAGDGVLLAIGSSPTFTNAAFRDNAGYAVYAWFADSTRASFEGNVATGNGTNGIHVGSSLAVSAAWSANLPYVLDAHLEVPRGATLAMSPGTVVKARHGARLLVHGTLLARGTAAQPIRFTAATDDEASGDTDGDQGARQPAAGSWGGIGFSASSVGSVLDHAIVRYGGCCRFTDDSRSRANVFTEAARLTIHASTISDASGAGIDVESGSPSITENTITRNLTGIRVGPSSRPALAGNAVDGNATGNVNDAGSSETRPRAGEAGATPPAAAR